MKELKITRMLTLLKDRLLVQLNDFGDEISNGYNKIVQPVYDNILNRGRGINYTFRAHAAIAHLYYKSITLLV